MGSQYLVSLIHVFTLYVYLSNTAKLERLSYTLGGSTLCFARVRRLSRLVFDSLLLFLLARLRPFFHDALDLRLRLLPRLLELEVSDDESESSDDDFGSDSEESDELDESDDELEGSLGTRPLSCLFGQFRSPQPRPSSMDESRSSLGSLGSDSSPEELL